MILRGRCIGSMRVDYTPRATDVTSIHARIKRAQADGRKHDHIEKMLQPLVAWNRSAFMDIPDKAFAGYTEKCTKAEVRRYQTEWQFHQGCLKSSPICWKKRAKVVEAVLASLRQRCTEVDPTSYLLQEPSNAESDTKTHRHLSSWSLFDTTVGFGRKLMECFDDPEESTEEYQDRIESCLYKFKMANKEAVYG